MEQINGNNQTTFVPPAQPAPTLQAQTTVNGPLPQGGEQVLPSIKTEPSYVLWKKIGLVLLVFFLLIGLGFGAYKMFFLSKSGNVINIQPQILSQRFVVDEIKLKRGGFFVIIMGNNFNAPVVPVYSSPWLPAGEYKDVVIEIGDETYKDLSSTYLDTTKLFAFLFDDTNKNGVFDGRVDNMSQWVDDLPLKKLDGKDYYVEINRP